MLAKHAAHGTMVKETCVGKGFEMLSSHFDSVALILFCVVLPLPV
jgi:hypothetical protein